MKIYILADMEGISGIRMIEQVQSESGDSREYLLPKGIHVNVQEGERVRAGEPLMDGPVNPHDILSVLGQESLWAW